ncbi:LysR family transcriptional regulator [Salaquimonas pukyongi]|uniref:LysR family transcriptional regulator n=1 Tax=Salaquimonas pukyongi TaxID=2712698 RepID=UPI00096BC538|nr:LysR family transcriptional regulator [Salaquimonas pukyongi]
MIENLKPVAVFAKVAETGSFSGAAKALGMSAPVVSQHISQLEKRLDTALIYRSTRSLSLTDAGRRFAVHARNMLDALADGFDEVEGDTQTPSGTLSVALPALILESTFMDWLACYIAKFPQIHLRLSFDDQFKDLVREGYDLAIRSGAMVDSSLKMRKLMDGELAPVATPEMIEKHGPFNRPSDLEREDVPWIGTHLAVNRLTFRQTGGGNDFEAISPKPNIMVDSALGAIKLIERGAGFGFAPKFYIESGRHEGRLAQVLDNWETDPIGVHAVWPANSGRRSLSRHFINFLEDECLPNLPAGLKRTASAKRPA